MKHDLKILVAYDGSEQADKALSEAIDIAQKFSGSITLLHIAWEESDEASNNLLKDPQKRLKKSGVKHTIRSERDENTPWTIARISRNEGFDLITIGSRGIGRVKTWMMGSVSSGVCSMATCPVLIVK